MRQLKEGRKAEMARARSRRSYRNNRAKRLQYSKRYRAEHPYNTSVDAKLRVDKRAEERKRIRNQLLEQQGFKCAICKTSEHGSQTWHRDHCRKTGLIRGLLCGRCNWGLGHFREDPRLLRAAARYIERKPSGPLYRI